MSITTLQQALEPGMAAATYDSQLQTALAYWQALQAQPSLDDTTDDETSLSGDDNQDTVVSDTATAIALLQAEISRIGG